MFHPESHQSQLGQKTGRQPAWRFDTPIVSKSETPTGIRIEQPEKPGDRTLENPAQKKIEARQALMLTRESLSRSLAEIRANLSANTPASERFQNALQEMNRGNFDTLKSLLAVEARNADVLMAHKKQQLENIALANKHTDSIAESARQAKTLAEFHEATERARSNVEQIEKGTAAIASIRKRIKNINPLLVAEAELEQSRETSKCWKTAIKSLEDWNQKRTDYRLFAGENKTPSERPEDYLTKFRKSITSTHSNFRPITPRIEKAGNYNQSPPPM